MNTGGNSKRVAVLISGRGSNMIALADAATKPDFPAEIVAVLSDEPEAAGLAAARRRGIATFAISRRDYACRTAHEAAMLEVLGTVRPDIICLAGYMQLLSADFVRQYQGRMINIHPSLLPLFAGLDTHERALAAGVRIHGCSVHFVTEGVDEGPLIAQAAVPVDPADDAASLSARVLAAEHHLYPEALRLLASGRARLDGNRVTFDLEARAGNDMPLFSPAPRRS